MVVLLGMASIPSFGPRAGFALLAAGAGLIGVGVVVSTVQTFLDRHPWVVGTAIGVCALLATVAAVLIYFLIAYRGLGTGFAPAKKLEAGV